MFGRTRIKSALAVDAQRHYAQVDRFLREKWGLSGSVYRVLDRLFNILTLGAVIWIISNTQVEPIYAMAFGVVLIGGVESLERYLLATNQDGGGQETDSSSDS